MLKGLDNDIQSINEFLQIKTPQAWVDYAVHNIPLLLIDHAHCERKAAATAINFISKYPNKSELVDVMSPLAREELLHFEKVVHIMGERQIKFGPLQPSNYATTLHQQVTKYVGEERLCDQLIIGAIIEARSCERFCALISNLRDQELAKFYGTLLRSEARHFQDYLRLARLYGGDISERLSRFIALENRVILSEDSVFRFHSGIPCCL